MNKGRNKRGQLFLLAAVVISAVIISLGTTANKAIVNDEPDELSDYTFNVKKEAGAVIDYEIYSGFKDGENLSNFVMLLAEDLRDRDPDLNFLFIYGTLEDLTLRNFGTKDVSIPGGLLSGGGYSINSKVKYGGYEMPTSEPLEDYSDGWKMNYSGLPEGAVISVNISEHEFKFEPTQYPQVIFIIQKEANNETYVHAK